jgi:hypothetical protein
MLYRHGNERAGCRTAIIKGVIVLEDIERALRPIRDSLQADGFDLRLDGFDDGIVSLSVVAGPDACHDCLLPQEHLQLRLEDKLRAVAQIVRLRYPEFAKLPH